MAQTQIRLRLSVKLPWWAKPYLALARLNAAIGIPVDPDTVAKTIADAMKVKAVPDG